MNWILLHDQPNNVQAGGKLIASFPEFSDLRNPDGTIKPHDIPQYVRVGDNFTSACLLTTVRWGTTGWDVYVAGNTLKSIPNQTHVNVHPVGALRYYFHRLRVDPSQRITLWGSGFAILGAGIDGALAIGKIKVYVPASADVLSALTGASSILKIVGVVLLLWKALLETK